MRSAPSSARKTSCCIPIICGSVYEEFVAVFLELHCFAPHRLPHYFPAIRDLDAVFRVLDADVDAAALFSATRLAGAPDPAPASPQAEEGEARAEAPAPGPAVHPNPAAYARRTRAATAAAERGNEVRAAVLLERAARRPDPKRRRPREPRRRRPSTDWRVGCGRPLGAPEAEAVVWRRGLGLLLGPAASGSWTREDRLLYDLQRVCIDQERDVYAVDLIEWMISWGRRPVVRLLPHQRQVNLVRRLRGPLIGWRPLDCPRPTEAASWNCSTPPSAVMKSRCGIGFVRCFSVRSTRPA